MLTEQPLALVGAGLSVPAGLPSWNALLDEMEAQLSMLDGAYKQALRDNADALWRAEEYRRYLGEQNYQSLLRNRFGAPVTLKADSAPVALVKLPFRHFMTTNYDDVLLEAHKVAKLDSPQKMNWSNEDEVRKFIFGLRNNLAPRTVLHLHGHHSNAMSIVLTDNDYTERYVRSADTTRKLFAILATERVVFVGFSLTDPDLMALLREVNATLRSDQARHFAIMGLEKPISEVFERGRLLKRYGVDPVFYDNQDQKHTGLLEVLHQIGGAVPASAPVKISARKKEPEPALFDPDDPQKGQWGGVASANGRKISAAVEEIESGWYKSTILVESTSKQKPLKGTVTFHVHPTFNPSVRPVVVRNGKAKLVLESYGSYTVGALADNGATRLELNLAAVRGAPLMFQMN
ncbi:MAG TPA: SIR2 family protein [Thermoanaerobaculia bacterium]|nr:SIR2 family protein [Thermoanaerobaculia bacterium]